METRRLTLDQLEIAAELLMQGKAVVMPTDTVYGVGVNAFDRSAIERLYRLKERPQEKGIPILLSDKNQLMRVITGPISEQLQYLIDQFWPGALTLILPKHSHLPDNISNNDGIAVRVPDHPLTQRLIAIAGGALAVSSANLSGELPAVSAEIALQTLNGRVSAVIDGGILPNPLPSTIIDCRTENYKILRSGMLTAEMLFR
jgi:L-threonylcarbamoyladenylate synthase